MMGTELMATIIIASTGLFALAGVFWNRTEKMTVSDKVRKGLKGRFLSSFFAGVFAVALAVAWLLFRYVGWEDNGLFLFIIGFIFIAQVISTYWLMYDLLKYGKP